MKTRIGLFLVALTLATACAACSKRHCVPEELTKKRALIDLSAAPDAHAPVSKTLTREVEAEFRKRSAGTHPEGTKPYHFLALSGGGLYGSFGVGVLNGWSETGTRPEFDVVTGISTGALMATFAFLGPGYDGVLQKNMLGVERADILRRRSLVRIPFSDAVFTSQPLKKRIEQVLTAEVLAEVAQAHAAGRRLYIGTTNIDAHRLIIWNMGEIAARGTPAARDLYRDIVLASSSIPGVFPPVRIPVEIDGKCYDEMHVDGGVSDEVIFRAFMVADRNRLGGVAGAFAPAGSTLTVVGNGKLYATPKCIRPRLTNMIGASFSSIIYGKTRDEMYRIYLNCLETGVAFRLTAVPQDFKLTSTSSLSLTPPDQQRLFEIGRELGSRPGVGEGWRDVPPGTDTSEQALPRAGTRFATRDGVAGPAPPPAPAVALPVAP